jgi:hypothetical protein
VSREPDKDYCDMTDDELLSEMEQWGKRVEAASGWSSAYCSAEQCAAIASVARRRGLTIENRWPIIRGGAA